MRIDFQKVWESHRDEFCRLIQIPSVYEESSVSPMLPYGEKVNEALKFMKTLCEQAGFAISEYDGYAISASWGGTKKRIDIASHLDVVAVADDWEEDPFSGSVHDGYVWGRGTQDMKSGAYLTFLALKLIKENWSEISDKPFPDNEIRLVFGTDEERTMDDMRYYVGKAGLPDFAFTPDGHFPMVTAEKGALMWIMEGDYEGDIFSLKAGLSPNIIPPFAEAVVKGKKQSDVELRMTQMGIKGSTEVVDEETGCPMLRICVEGKAAHASRPEDGHSALSDLLKLLAAILEEEDVQRLAVVFKDPYGVGAGLDFDLPPMGKLTLNPGVMTISTGRIYAMIDARYPMVESALLTDILRRNFPSYTVSLPYDDLPTFVEEDDPYILAMKEAYRETLSKECTSMVLGGVSYCKVFGHCVTFGTVSEREPSLAHQKNEKISEQDCVEALEIYYRTILKLLEIGA